MMSIMAEWKCDLFLYNTGVLLVIGTVYSLAVTVSAPLYCYTIKTYNREHVRYTSIPILTYTVIPSNCDASKNEL